MITYSQQEVIDWLDEIEAGQIDLHDDNMGLATAALALLQVEPAPSPEPEPEPLPPGNLSPHFTLAEMIASDTAAMNGIDNTPNQAALDQLTTLTNVTLEQVRALCGDNPLIVTSGFRCQKLNQAVGGASNSAHLYGCAADFTIPAYGSVLDVCHAIQDHLDDFQVDQLIYENEAWVHIGRAIPPNTIARQQCLTIANGQTTNGIP